MADIRKKLESNVEGEFFVDSTCIDCDTCRQLAPATFTETGEYSSVYAQPKNEVEYREAIRALLACPTGSIGTVGRNTAKEVRHDFPLNLVDDVYYNGFNSPKSFGGNSYFIRHPDGNWLVDSPKDLPFLVDRFGELGGISRIFLTHSDDVADADKYAEAFQAERIIHAEEAWSQPGAEIIIEGFEPVPFGKDFLVIPTPGHTRGHCVLLYKNQYLFTGDHMSWDRNAHRLEAPHYYYWSKPEIKKSIRRLQDYQFSWVFPGHGQQVHLPAERMHAAVSELAERYPKAS